MARDEKKPTAAEKGKGKAESTGDTSSDKKLLKDKQDVNGKPTTNGKVVDDLPEGMRTMPELFCHCIELTP